MTAQNIIDMSKLPVPDAISVPDAELMLADFIAKLQQLDPVYNALLESDPAYKQGEAVTWRSILFRQSMNDAIRAVLLASSAGADLDNIGANFNVERLLIHARDDNATPPVPAMYEKDDPFRTRIQLSWARLSTAGAENAYVFFASGADGDVLDAQAYGPETHSKPGYVYLYVLSRTGDGTAPAELVQKVVGAVTPKDVRPLTDYVITQSASIIPYRVDADIYIPYGLDGDEVMRTAETALGAYISSVHRIGSVVARSGIDGGLHRPGVVKVILRSPATDITPAMGEAPFCTGITLNRIILNAE